MELTNANYRVLRELFRSRRLPFAFVDLDAFDANVEYVANHTKSSKKTVRLGSKSIRCEPLMRRILQDNTIYQGFLTYTVEESAFLAAKGHDDFIVAYPTVQPSDMELLVKLTADDVRISLMVDSLEQLKVLSAAATRAKLTLSACLEIDLAYRPFGDLLHLGLRRSPIRTPEGALLLVEKSRMLPGVIIDCLMGYEGHIAGVSDALPSQPLKNALMRNLKNASVRELSQRRRAIVQALINAGLELKNVNGGGSGSLVSTLKDDSVTEVTVGSGFFAPGLFHHFTEVQYLPAAYFALQVVRRPASDIIACQGGGYIASGPTGKEKAPTPVMPRGLKFIPLEGAGEVSTPLMMPPDCPNMKLGDPIFFQHAKAGELCEHFDELYLVKDGHIVDKVLTYRGEGMNFL